MKAKVIYFPVKRLAPSKHIFRMDLIMLRLEILAAWIGLPVAFWMLVYSAYIFWR